MARANLNKSEKYYRSIKAQYQGGTESATFEIPLSGQDLLSKLHIVRQDLLNKGEVKSKSILAHHRFVLQKMNK